ncbi:hypothetical protein F4815DRAFT_185293 [Daldinia loculata]|nr:hypothetical protein F4815DRAFT_185293 [Daldinia loculata]
MAYGWLYWGDRAEKQYLPRDMVWFGMCMLCSSMYACKCVSARVCFNLYDGSRLAVLSCIIFLPASYGSGRGLVGLKRDPSLY